MIWLQILLNSLTSAGIYALVAYGFSLVYSTNRIVHFAHGGLVVVSAYSFFAASRYFSIIPAIFYALFISLILALIFHYFYLAFQRKNASAEILLIVSFGLLILIQAAIQLVFGANIKTVSYFDARQGLNLFGAYITPVQISIILIAFISFIILLFFSKYTKLGKTFRAVSSNKEVAQIIGINTRRIQLYSFILSGIIGCIAGVLITLEQNISPTIGSGLIIKGFTATIIGGIGSIPGAGLGALLLGLAENIGIWFLPSGYKDAIAFTLLIIFLLLRPKGILGK